MTFKLFPVAVASVLSLALLAGCSPEANPTREARKEAKLLKKQSPLDTPQAIQPESRNVNEAQLVLNACGKPATEAVLPIYNKSFAGPVLRLVYDGRQAVTLTFVPTPVVGSTLPKSRPANPPNTAVASNQTWEFDEAQIEGEELMTSKSLSIYLPCAAQGLSKFE